MLANRQNLLSKLAKARQQLKKAQTRVAELEALVGEDQPNLVKSFEFQPSHHRILDHLIEGCQIIGFDWRYLYVNDVTAQHGRLPKEALLGHTMMERYPGIEDTPVFAALRRCMEERIAQRMDNEFIYPDGKKAWFELSIQPVPEGIFILSLDITERKQAEEALRRYAERLKTLHPIDRAILTAQPVDATVRLVLEFILQQLPTSRVSVTLFDFEAQEATLLTVYSKGKTKWPTGARFSLGSFPGEYTDILRQGTIHRIDDITALPDPPPGIQAIQEEGVRTYVRVPLKVQNDLIGSLSLGADTPGGFVQEHLDIAREIADQLAIALHQAQLREQIQRHTEELEQRVEARTIELRRSKERVEAIINTSSDAIILASTEGLIRQTNPAFNALFGYEVDECFGQPLTTLVTPDGIDDLTAMLQEVTTTRQPGRLEIAGRRKDGTTFDGELVTAAMADGEGMVCSLRDVSERKLAEQKLHEALQKERELNELRARFVSMVSHEFRTPLATIQSSSDLVRHYGHKMEEERKQEHLENIAAQVARLTELLDYVLFIGKAQTVGLEFKPTSLDLAAFCQTIVQEIQQITSKHQLTFTVRGESTNVVADEKLLRRAFTNLLSNAVKYSPKGGEVYFDLLWENTEAVIRVRDQGIGIPKEDQKRLFELFHRAGNVGNIAGTGLGLAIIKQAVEAHGGTIEVESEMGQGTTFTVRLPVRS